MIAVCTSATGHQLTELATLKSFLFGATATSTANDSILDTYISIASDLVEQYLGYPLVRQVYSESLPSYGDNQLMLSRTPVQAVEIVLTGDGDELASASYTIEEPDAGLIRSDDGFPWSVAIQSELESRPVIGSESRSYTVVYEAGYTLSCSTSTGDWLTNTTGRTLPYWAEQGVLETAKSLYKRRAADGAVQSKRIGDLSITYGSGSVNEALRELPGTAVSVLRAHARSV